jgi:hypothetical protein
MANEALRARTDAKLRYARLHLQELKTSTTAERGHDFERAHQEAFFAQLFGAYAAMLQELNDNLGCALTPTDVSLGKMRKTMMATGDVCPKLTELYTLERDETTWFAQAKTMRDHVSHVAGIPLVFYAGGDNDGLTAFKHPKNFTEIPGDYICHLQEWCNQMEMLVEHFRS